LYIPGNPPVNTPNMNFGLSPHFEGKAAAILNGNAYFIGGYPTTNAVTIFNPTTNRSTSGSPLNIARYAHAATVVDDTIIVCGGYNGSTYWTFPMTSCEQFNLSNNKWNLIASVPAVLPISTSIMATLNNRAYVFGGSTKCDASLSPVNMFDGKYWVAGSSIVGLPWYWHAGVAIDSDRALICGGAAYKDGKCQWISDCFIYSASSDSWAKSASMAQVRCVHSMVMFEGETWNKNVVDLYHCRPDIHIRW
jgi:N-acetylneuraminic acid mutarotase